MTRYVGGPVDGKETEATAPVVTVPIVTPEFTEATRAWQGRHLVAYTFWQVGGGHGEPPTPHPPRFPKAYYRRTAPDSDYIFDRIEA